MIPSAEGAAQIFAANGSRAARVAPLNCFFPSPEVVMTEKTDKIDKTSFERSAESPQQGLLDEFLHFLLNNKKWWLTPIIVTLLLVALLIVLSGSAAAPFIYTLF
jgi:hypothetical protein